jgi:hypothetical protein
MLGLQITEIPDETKGKRRATGLVTICECISVFPERGPSRLSDGEDSQ